MARGKKFHFTYGTQNNEQHTVEIWVEGFAGTSEELQPAAMPVVVDYNKTVAESYMGGIVPAQITINVQSSSTFKASVFTSQNYGDVIIKHKTGSTVDFNCVLVPFVTRDIDLPDGAYGVELSCEFGLNYLKNVDYPTSTNRVKLATVLHTCISYVPVEDTFSYKILDGVLVASDSYGTDATRYFESYVSEENYADKTCYEVLDDICQGIREIFFSDGYWWVRNLAEINKGDSTIYNYSSAGAYVDSTAYARPTTEAGAGVRLKGAFGKEFSHKNVKITKPKSIPIVQFSEGEFDDLTDWTFEGLAALLFDTEDGKLTNLGNTIWNQTAETDPNYIVNTNPFTYQPFKNNYDLSDNEVLTLKLLAENGGQIKNLRLQIIAQQDDVYGHIYFLDSDGAWYRQDASTTQTPMYLVKNTNTEVKIEIPRPPYNSATFFTSYLLPIGVYEGLNYLIPPVGNVDYNIYIRIYLPERINDNSSGGADRFSLIDYVRFSIEKTGSEVFDGFSKDYGVTSPTDRTGKLDISFSTGFNAYPHGAETLFDASTGEKYLPYFKGVADILYNLVDDFVSRQYLDILSIRHKSWIGELYEKVDFDDLIEIDSVKYRVHNLKLDRWNKISKVTLVELASSTSSPDSYVIELPEDIKLQIEKIVKSNAEKLIFNNENFEISYGAGGLKELRLRANSVHDEFSSKLGLANLLKEGNESTTALNWTDIDGTVTDYIRPKADGFFYLKTEGNSEEQIATADTAWMLGATNVLTAASDIGSASGDYDIGLKRAGTTIATIKSDMFNVVDQLGISGGLGSIGSPAYTDLSFRGYLDRRTALIRSYDQSSSTVVGGGIEFLVNENLLADSLNSAMLINGFGNVGIGTTPSYNYKLDVAGTGRFTGEVTFGSNAILATAPTIGNHLTNKTYVDTLFAGTGKWGVDVKTISLSNITLSGTQTVSGYALSIGERVLVAGQSTASENGIYLVASGSWTRATDSDSDAELRGYVYTVSAGDYSGYKYRNSNTSAITVDTTDVTYVLFDNNTETDPVFVAWRDSSRSQNYVFAAPSSGSGTASFRALVASDIPSLDWSKITSGTPTTLAGYGITDAYTSTEGAALETILNSSALTSGYLPRWDGSKFVDSRFHQGEFYNSIERRIDQVISGDNTYFGKNVGMSSDGTFAGNTGFGFEAIKSVTNAAYNTAIGYKALSSLTSGQAVVSIGYESLSSAVGGNVSSSVSIGYRNLKPIGASNSSGGFVSIGANIGTSATRVLYSTLIGHQITPTADSQNEIAVGWNITTKGNNTATWGNTLITDHYFTGNIRYTGNLMIDGTVGSDKQVLASDGTNNGWTSLASSHITDWSADLNIGGHITASGGISETLTLTEGSFERVLKGLYLSGGDTDTRETFFVGTDFNTGAGVFRLQYYNPSDVLSAVEMSFDLADAGRPIVYDPKDATEAIKHVMYQEDFDELFENAISGVSIGGGTVGNLNQVLTQGNNSSIRAQFNGVNYATVEDLHDPQNLASVLSYGTLAEDLEINFKATSASASGLSNGLKYLDESDAEVGLLNYNNLNDFLYLYCSNGMVINGQYVSITSNNVSLGTSIPQYADNASAIIGGLQAGRIYRTGDILKIVH